MKLALWLLCSASVRLAAAATDGDSKNAQHASNKSRSRTQTAERTRDKSSRKSSSVNSSSAVDGASVANLPQQENSFVGRVFEESRWAGQTTVTPSKPRQRRFKKRESAVVPKRNDTVSPLLKEVLTKHVSTDFRQSMNQSQDKQSDVKASTKSLSKGKAAETTVLKNIVTSSPKNTIKSGIPMLTLTWPNNEKTIQLHDTISDEKNACPSNNTSEPTNLSCAKYLQDQKSNTALLCPVPKNPLLLSASTTTSKSSANPINSQIKTRNANALRKLILRFAAKQKSCASKGSEAFADHNCEKDACRTPSNFTLNSRAAKEAIKNSAHKTRNTSILRRRKTSTKPMAAKSVWFSSDTKPEQPSTKLGSSSSKSDMMQQTLRVVKLRMAAYKSARNRHRILAAAKKKRRQEAKRRAAQRMACARRREPTWKTRTPENSNMLLIDHTPDAIELAVNDFQMELARLRMLREKKLLFDAGSVRCSVPVQDLIAFLNGRTVTAKMLACYVAIARRNAHNSQSTMLPPWTSNAHTQTRVRKILQRRRFRNRILMPVSLPPGTRELGSDRPHWALLVVENARCAKRKAPLAYLLDAEPQLYQLPGDLGRGAFAWQLCKPCPKASRDAVSTAAQVCACPSSRPAPQSTALASALTALRRSVCTPRMYRNMLRDARTRRDACSCAAESGVPSYAQAEDSGVHVLYWMRALAGTRGCATQSLATDLWLGRVGAVDAYTMLGMLRTARTRAIAAYEMRTLTPIRIESWPYPA